MTPPDWLILIASTVITAIIAPIVADFLRRRRNAVDIEKLDAEADKIRAETRLLEAGELEARVQRIVDAAVLGTAEIIEQQRGEIIDLRNTVRTQQDQIAIMSETINRVVAENIRAETQISQLKLELESVHTANLSLLERIQELEDQGELLPDGVIAP